MLDLTRHRLLASWAADCAEHVLPLFTRRHPDDDRPRRAIEAARAWSRGEITVGAARQAALQAHAAAREAADEAACAAARAAGQAVSAPHAADHSLAAAAYAVRAVKRVNMPLTPVAAAAGESEHRWQHAQLPEAVRELVVSAQEQNSVLRNW